MIGDRLYVKEGLEKTSTGDRMQYRRDKVHLQPPVMGGAYGWRWRRDNLSPLYMPKEAARLWLEITGVQVERLTCISRDDAKAEGMWPGANGLEQAAGRSHGNAQLAFQELWESIHGAGSWDLNPWVWVIGFRNGVLVLIEWVWAYLRFERGARLITGEVGGLPLSPGP